MSFPRKRESRKKEKEQKQKGKKMEKRTKNEDRFSAEFRASTRRLPAAARSRTEVHRVRAVGQEQRSNHPKEPLRIELTFGKWAIVDAADYQRLSKYKWHAVKERRNWYAKTLRRNGMPLGMHRLITDAPKGLFVDHIDHNGLNNCRSNLRICSNAENSRNKRPYGRTSRYKGVSWHKGSKKFVAQITFKGKKIWLGYFVDEIDAAKAYDKKAKELFGEFAYLNFPAEATEEN
jgi:hypothetical protein